MKDDNNSRTPNASRLLKFLKGAYVEDDEVSRIPLDKCGWRTLGQIAQGTGLPVRSLYGKKSGNSGTELNQLIKDRLVEIRYFKGERGRGGEVARFRILSVDSRRTSQRMYETPLGQTEISSVSLPSFSQMPIESSARRLASIMFTDMVGYTALTQSNEGRALEVLERHNHLLRPIFPRYGGREVKSMGDSFLVEFDSALEATKCAIEIQEFLHDYNFSSREEWKINLRIGIHLGDVIHREGDVFGDAVNIASRIEPLADPEGICLSEQVFDQVTKKLDYSLIKVEHGGLKNVSSPVTVYRVALPWEKEEGEQRGKTTTQTGNVPAMDKGRIAVMPLVSLTSDRDDEYFADGMTEELLSAVSLIEELSVISRTSVMSYKNKQDKRTIDIGRELNVGTLLEGSVRKAGDRVRISVQLIDVASDKHLWAQNYDRRLEDVFVIQSDVANRVAESLEARFLLGKKHRIENTNTRDVSAHLLYLKGRDSYFKFTREDVEDAIRLYGKAIEKDPNYALAYAGIAEAFSFLGISEFLPSRDAFSKAKGYAERALSIDKSFPEAHVSVGYSSLFEWDFEKAELEYRRSIELNPNLSASHYHLSSLLWATERYGEAKREALIALDLDPLSFLTCSYVGRTFLFSRDYEKAIEVLEKAVKIGPLNAIALANLGLAHVQKGMLQIGIAEMEKAAEIVAPDILPMNECELAFAYSKAGYNNKSREILSLLLDHVEQNPGWALAIAGVFSVLEEKEKAFEWLEKAYVVHSGWMPYTAAGFVFDHIRIDPRFDKLLLKIGSKRSYQKESERQI